jgi:Tol biopolymer transport system component
MKIFRLAIATLAVLLFQFTGCTERPTDSLEEKLLATVPDSFEVEWGRNKPVFSPDGTKVAYVASQGDNQRRDIARTYFVVLGNNKNQDFNQIHGNPVFSPDGSKLAYSVNQNGKGFIVVRDSAGIETKGPEFDSAGLWEPIVCFSRDGTKMVYTAMQGGRWFVVNGDRREVPSGFGTIGWATCSPDGNRIAYSADTGTDQMCVVVDGKPGQIFHDVNYPIFSPDGSKVAYEARRITVGEIGSRSAISFLVIGDKKGPEFGRVDQYVFSPDGSKVAYVASTGQGVSVMIAGEHGEEFADVRDPSFSHDGGKIAFAAEVIRGKWAVVVGDKRGPQFDAVFQPTFLPMAARSATVRDKERNYGGRLWMRSSSRRFSKSVGSEPN